MKIILQKIIAESGYASRRKGEELIRAGKVRVNGEIAQVGDKAEAGVDEITVNNYAIGQAVPKIYIKMNKPLGYTCTNQRFPGEKNIFDLIDLPERLFAVGRLDKGSRGLLLLTNDGELTQRLAHPRFQHNKVYEVQTRGEIRNGEFICAKMMQGVDIGEGDGIARARDAQYLQNHTFIITLNEGKKRQIRRMFRILGLQVLDLRRVSIAGLTIGNLPEGHWTYLTKEEVNHLKYEQ